MAQLTAFPEAAPKTPTAQVEPHDSHESEVMLDAPTPEQEAESPGTWQLRKLSPRHRTAAALLAQGVRRQNIAAACNFTPSYITWLGRQPLFREHIREIAKFADARLDALFIQGVEVLAETMRDGSEDGKLRAVKLQMEATQRIGRYMVPDRPRDGEDSLEHLADRLVSLMHKKRSEHGQEPIQGTHFVVEDPQQLSDADDATQEFRDASLAPRTDPAAEPLAPEDAWRNLMLPAASQPPTKEKT